MEYLTVKEIAILKNCSEQYIKRIVKDGVLPHKMGTTPNNRPLYLIPLSSLEPALQRKWYKNNGVAVPASLKAKATKEPVKSKPLESYSKEQRETIEYWVNLLDEWQSYRAGSKDLSITDAAFIKEKGLAVSDKTLYRRLAAYKKKDWDGLVDKRGQWRKGKSEFPTEIKDFFEYCYLDETDLNIQKCIEATEDLVREFRPDLKEQMPKYHTFYRWAKSYSAPVAALARKGDKYFNDKFGIYVDRLYDDMVSNDYWIADGHRIDVITKSENGLEQQHRLTLSAFIDARSGIYVGWVVTDNPSSDATMLALRKAIMKYGTPKYLYVDNGREYLNIDIGGMGHRTRKKKVDIKLPTPILTRLGIQMTNALPRNAQAKTIEREFRNFTFLSSLFETYVGSNVVVKPEKLKSKLKNGQIPTDGELTQVVESMIEGYFNCQPYGGKVVADRGKPKLQVYQEQLLSMRVVPEEDLNLMMMRSTRMQTIGRNGVYVRIGGEKIFFFDDELLFLQGQKVFVRFDPEVLDEVRIYDEDEVFLRTAPMRMDMVLEYGATKDGISHAMSEKRKWRRMAKEEINISREKIISQYGHINMLDIRVRAANMNREGLFVPSTNVVELIRSEEVMQRLESTGTDGTNVIIDRQKMIANNER